MDAIHEYLAAAERVLGLRLCLHRRDRLSLRRHRWGKHSDPACMAVKRVHQRACAAYCGDAVHHQLRRDPTARLLRCPFGHSELVAGVSVGGSLGAVLFAGPCWLGAGEPPRADLHRPPSQQWLDDRLLLLDAVARQLARLIPAEQTPSDRRSDIVAFLQHHLEETLGLDDLAEHLGLSPSRAGHVVRERCGCSFTELVHRLRIEEAARLLAVTDERITAIALRFGYTDQSHFGRWFRRIMGASPARWRRQRQHRPKRRAGTTPTDTKGCSTRR